MTIREHLLTIQAKEGMSDEAMAARLGISRSAWTRIKLGHRNVGGKVLRGVAREFPHLITSETVAVSA